MFSWRWKLAMKCRREAQRMHGIYWRTGDGLEWNQYWRGVEHTFYWRRLMIGFRLRRRDRPMHEFIRSVIP